MSSLSGTPDDLVFSMGEGFLEVMHLSLERRHAVKMIFTYIDSNHSGSISREEVYAYGRLMNVNFTTSQLEKLMSLLDVDSDGAVSEEEFLMYFAKLGRRLTDEVFFRGISVIS